MFGTLEQEGIEQLLASRLVGRIGCHAEGITYVIPISYAYDGAYIYCHTWEGMKIDIMRKNPAVCFQIDQMDNMANWKSVVAWGVFEELTDVRERRQGLQQLVNRELPAITSETVQLTSTWPFAAKDVDTIKGIVFRIRITEKTGRFEKYTAALVQNE